MPYKCLKCCKVFVHAAKKTETHQTSKYPPVRDIKEQLDTITIFVTELYVCPYCNNSEYEEYTKPSELQQAISHLTPVETEPVRVNCEGVFLVAKFDSPKKFNIPAEHICSNNSELSLYYNVLTGGFVFATFDNDNRIEFHSKGAVCKAAGVNIDGMTIEEATTKLTTFLLQYEVKPEGPT